MPRLSAEKQKEPTCHAGSGSELNISEEVFEFRLRDMESLNWMMRKARLEGRY